MPFPPNTTAVTIVTPMVLFSGLLYQRSKISSGLQWLADTSMVRDSDGPDGKEWCRALPGGSPCV